MKLEKENGTKAGEGKEGQKRDTRRRSWRNVRGRNREN
jgi:hypothetical protein